MSTKGMRLSFPLRILPPVLLVGAALLLNACHTTAGAGEDISKTGSAIENSAKRNTP